MSAIDFTYLESFAAGDGGVVRDVLSIFREQAELWSVRLEARGADWRDLAHTIKGAARGIGANALGDACETAEFGTPEDLPAVKAELDQALAAISAYEARKAA